MIKLTSMGLEGDKSGIQMTFANGNTISIQWHELAYSSNRIAGIKIKDGCVSAEVAIWDENSMWVTMSNGDRVAGWQDADQISKLIQMASTMSVKEIEQITIKEEIR